MVAGAGVAGLAGLLAGRWLADRAGRRLTGALAMATVALCATVTYTGSAPALLAGDILGVFAASVFAPAAGSLVNELFPTSVRASVAGWSLAAGVLGAVRKPQEAISKRSTIYSSNILLVSNCGYRLRAVPGACCRSCRSLAGLTEG